MFTSLNYWVAKKATREMLYIFIKKSILPLDTNREGYCSTSDELSKDLSQRVIERSEESNISKERYIQLGAETMIAFFLLNFINTSIRKDLYKIHPNDCDITQIGLLFVGSLLREAGMGHNYWCKTVLTLTTDFKEYDTLLNKFNLIIEEIPAKYGKSANELALEKLHLIAQLAD